MQYKKIGSKYLLRVDKGEEIIASITKLCKDETIKLGAVSGIGAAEKVVLGIYNVATRKFHPREFNGPYEIASLTGNITEMDGEAHLHIHSVIGDREMKAFAGHLKEAVVGGTAEIMIVPSEGKVGRKLDKEVTGLNLLRFR